MCAKSSSASAASLAKASTSGSVATRTEFVDASAISRASASLWAAHPRNARPRRRGQGDTHCGLSVFYRHPSGDRCSFGRCGGSQRFCVRWPCSGRRLFLIVFDAAELNNLVLDNLVLGATWPRNFLLHGTPLEFNNLALDEALRSATQDGAQFATILRDAGKRPYRAGFLMRRFERRSVQARRSFFYRFCNNDGAVEHISRQRCFDCFRYLRIRNPMARDVRPSLHEVPKNIL